MVGQLWISQLREGMCSLELLYNIFTLHKPSWTEVQHLEQRCSMLAHGKLWYLNDCTSREKKNSPFWPLDREYSSNLTTLVHTTGTTTTISLFTTVATWQRVPRCALARKHDFKCHEAESTLSVVWAPALWWNRSRDYQLLVSVSAKLSDYSQIWPTFGHIRM